MTGEPVPWERRVAHFVDKILGVYKGVVPKKRERTPAQGKKRVIGLLLTYEDRYVTTIASTLGHGGTAAQPNVVRAEDAIFGAHEESRSYGEQHTSSLHTTAGK